MVCYTATPNKSHATLYSNTEQNPCYVIQQRRTKAMLCYQNMFHRPRPSSLHNGTHSLYNGRINRT